MVHRGVVAGQTLAQGSHQMRMAQAVVLVLDGEALMAGDRSLSRPEIALAATVVAEGRALIAVINKLDAVAPHQRQRVPVYRGPLPHSAYIAVNGIREIRDAISREKGCGGVYPQPTDAANGCQMPLHNSDH